MTENAIPDTLPLKWDLFVTPSTAYVSSFVPPRETTAIWSPISSTLIYGNKDAVLVDRPITIEQKNALIDLISASGKNLTTIYIIHGHGDHWFGIGALLNRFPKARAVASRNVLPLMRQQASPESIGSGQHGFQIKFQINSSLQRNSRKIPSISKVKS